MNSRLELTMNSHFVIDGVRNDRRLNTPMAFV